MLFVGFDAVLLFPNCKEDKEEETQMFIIQVFHSGQRLLLKQLIKNSILIIRWCSVDVILI